MCLQDQTPLPEGSRPDRRYCSDRCRVAAHPAKLQRGSQSARSQREGVLAQLQQRRQALGLPRLIVDAHLESLAGVAAAKTLASELEELAKTTRRRPGMSSEPARSPAALPDDQLARATHVGLAGARGPSREAVLCVVLGRKEAAG